MLASGAVDVLSAADPYDLDEQVRAALDGTQVAVGVLPFAAGMAGAPPSRLVIPQSCLRAGPAHPAAADLRRVEVDEPVVVRPVPEPAHHVEAVRSAIGALRDGRVRKVVLARALDVEFASEVRPEPILRNLVREHPAGYTFAAPLPGERTLLGASPELLISRHGDRVLAHPHAGSLPRSSDPDLDAENGKALLASAKDRVEHAVLIEAIAETLRPHCRTLDVPAEPELVATPTIWHLRTTITGELDGARASALRLAAALHPTPAICGTPTGSARELIGELESFDRDYYAGALGWVDAAGDGEWAVTIRCAELAGTSMRLYAGGGIVPGSDPNAELDETTAKFTTLQRAFT